MKLTYQAVDRSGRVIDDVIEASDSVEAVELLRREGLFVSSLTEAGGAVGPKGRPATAKRRSGQRLRDVAMFTRQLSVLLSTGTPLVQSITALEKQSRVPAWSAVIADLRLRLEEGDSFAVALESHPLYFDPIYRSLVEAGETSGQLDEMLRRLARVTRQRMHTRSIVMGALMYPSILMSIAVVVLGVMIGFVLPRFTGLFETLDAPLPPTTKFLLALSDAIKSYWWLMLPGMAAGGVALFALLKSNSGREFCDRHVLRLPTFGALVQSFATARLTRLLGTLLESRVPLLDALRLTRAGCTNSLYAALVSEAEDAVTHGSAMSTVLAQSPLVDPTIAEAIRCGEDSGQIGPVLVNIADFLEEENEIVLKNLSSIIEPIILILLGLLVGVVAISMFMPLFDITATVPGGGA